MARDDYDDRGPSFPGTVTAAGAIWILFGGIGVLGTVLNLMGMGAQGAQGGNPAAGACPACVGGLIAAAFLHVGLQSVRGQAKDTLGNGIGSIVLSLFYFGLAALMGFAGFVVGQPGAVGPNAGNAPAANAGLLQAVSGVMAVILAGFGLLLLLAGVLALVGRQQYREWRMVYGPAPKRRPRNEDDDSDNRRRRDRDEESGDRRRD